MRKIEWTDDLAVDTALIDEQHKTWISRLNDVSQAIEQHQGPQRVAEAIGFLNDYTNYHFATEERYMTEHAYPELVSHKQKHEDLKKALADLENEYEEDGATHLLANSIDTFAINWLFTHIRETDTKFGAFLRSRGVVLHEQA